MVDRGSVVLAEWLAEKAGCGFDDWASGRSGATSTEKGTCCGKGQALLAIFAWFEFVLVVR